MLVDRGEENIPLTETGRKRSIINDDADVGDTQRTMEEFEMELNFQIDGTDDDPDLDKSAWGRFKIPKCRAFLTNSGPGLATILGSTDAGCLILACAAGKQMGYAMIPVQLMLSIVQMVMLFYASRLGTASGMGFVECIQQFHGRTTAIAVALLLIFSCFVEMIQEFSGLAGVSEIIGVHRSVGVLSGALVFLATVLLGGTSIHKIVVGMGLSLVVFVPLMFYSNPNGDYISKGWDRIDLTNQPFLILTAAQAGGMVIPWMVFYQQSTVACGQFSARHLGSLHLDVVLGTVFTVIVVTSATAFVAGSLWEEHGDTDQPLRSVIEVSDAVKPYLGKAGQVMFCIGFSGAALVGGLCLSTTAAMLFNEVLFSLAVGPGGADRHTPTSRLSSNSAKVYTIFVLAAAAVVLSGVEAVEVTVLMALVNAMISAIIIGLMLSLGLKILQNETTCDYIWTTLVGTCVIVFATAAATGVSISFVAKY